MLNEQRIIESLKQSFSIPGGIGDDAAIFGNYVITKDLLVEDVHFRRSYVDAISLGYKALQVNLSDLAAMGAKPAYVLLGISIPKDCEQYIEEFLASFANACHQENVQLIGGDTTASPDKLYISVTAIGITSKPKLRSGAKIGDIICVVGNLGHAHLGFTALENNLEGFDEFKTAFLRPKAKIKEGIWLGSQKAVTAMMDVSDGLTTDLNKLCKASDISAEIDIINFQKNIPIETILTGGEDYALLITVDSNQYDKLVAEADFSIQKIGKIIEGESGEVTFKQDIAIKLKKFSHFGEL